MSCEAKVQLMEDIKTKMSDMLTVSTMNKLMETLEDEFTNYDINHHDLVSSGEDDMVDSFLNALNVEGKSPKTIKLYRYQLGRMLKTVGVPTGKITADHIRTYLSNEKARGLADKTLNNIRNICSSYFGWLYQEEKIPKNPLSNIKNVKAKKKVEELFSDTDIELLKSACDSKRDKSIVTFMLSTGCRIGEMVALNKDAINFQLLTVKVLGKGNKERTVYLDSVSAMFLKNYLNSRTDTDEYLFRSKRLCRFTDEGVRKMLLRIEEKSGVNHVYPHKFRRTLATNLHRRGMPIEKIKEILGHDSINTTMQYIVLDQSDIEHDYRKFA